VQLTSSARRALGLLTVSTIGMTTAVVGVTGVAQAAIPAWDAEGSGASQPVPAGICSIQWTLSGGGAGLDSDDAGNLNAGFVFVQLPATAGEVYTLYPGGRGTDADGLTPGTGGTSGDPDPDTQGTDGTANTEMAGGGGGAASTVVRGGTTMLQAYGADADDSFGLGGLGGGDGVNFAVGAPEWFNADESDFAQGEITGEGIPCAPSVPTLNFVEELDGALRLDFATMDDGDLPTDHYEYSRDGADWLPLTGVTEQDGRLHATLGGLTNGTEYTIAVRAVSATGVPSHTRSALTGTPYKRAGVPADARVVADDGRLTVSWGASSPGTYPILGYVAAVVWNEGERGGGSTLCETGPAEFTCTAPVQPGVTHDVVVYAVHADDRTGEWAFLTSGVVPASSALPHSDGDLELPAGSTASVPAGKTITVSGSGYAPFSMVTVLIYSEPQVLTVVQADENGNFTVTVTVPAGLAPGQHTLVASGFDGDGNLRNVTLPVTVVAGLAYTGADIAVPAIGGLAALTAGGALLVVARRRRVG
jgi:hypothetical protein